MKVLVTGATGFIGNHVVRYCLEQGDQVRAMVMPGENVSALEGLDVEYVEADLAQPETLARVVDGVEGIYHLAAIYALWLPDPTLMYRVNVEGTRALMQAAMAAGVKRVVFTSSIAALGVEPSRKPATETTGFNMWRYSNDYIWSKYISEQEVRGLIARGLPAVIVNPAFPFGPGDRAPTPTGAILLNILKGRLRGTIEGGFNLVDVRDVARGHLLAMAKGRVGEGYILANRNGNMTFNDFARLVSRIAGIQPPPARRISPKLMGVVAKALEGVAEVTKKPPLTTYKTIMYASQYLYYDPTKAIEELGLPQTPAEVSVEEAIVWFRRHGYV